MASARRPRSTATSDLRVALAGSADARAVYGNATDAAARLWRSAKAGDGPDPAAAKQLVDDLSDLLARDRRSLLALASAGGDNVYTVTHMVNVAALTLALAADLGVDGPLLHAFGVAALLHDIGKVRTPDEILFKPGPLTLEEFDIVKRHVIDGAAILGRTPGMSPLSAVVAFEHHLRRDLSGYPERTRTQRLNLCTELVIVADVFDALRSDRPYRQGVPMPHAVAIMTARNTEIFNVELLDRFVALLDRFHGDA